MIKPSISHTAFSQSELPQASVLLDILNSIDSDMSKPAIFLLKTIAHLLCLAPIAWLLRFGTSSGLILNPDPVNFITRFTGDWALYMLLASLAITPIRRLSVKISWLIRLRRLIGLYAFFYATLHLAIYTFIYSGYNFFAAFAGLHTGHPGALLTQWKVVWPAVFADLRKRLFIEVGFFAWVILLALAVTSPAFIMRAIREKNWQRLHFLVYVAAIAAVIHFWWLVKTGIHTPWKDTAALTLLALVAYTTIQRSKTALLH